MKKIVVSLFVLVALLALIVVPTFAQDKPGTIADVVVASTNASTPEFTTLLAAVQAADPAIMQLLSNPDANVTVFAPTDAAFAAALQSLNMTADELLADQALLNKVLMYHIVPGRFDAASVVALNGALLGTSLPETGLAISVDGSQVKVNDATVVTPDVMAANGVIHVIDTVLLPPMDNTMATPEAMMTETMPMQPAGTIADVVITSAKASAPEFTTLLAAVQAADPAILAALTGNGPYTVFAPTDAAFNTALASLKMTAADLLNDKAMLTKILSYHVVPGYFSAATVISVAGVDGAKVATLLPGTSVNITVVNGSVKINDATVITPDVIASNGIIHVIDGVLLPPSA